MKKNVLHVRTQKLTAPVSMSYIRAPRLHQSTALLCPLRINISGALGQKDRTVQVMGSKVTSQSHVCRVTFETV